MPASQVTNIHAGDQNTADMSPEISNSICIIMPFPTFSTRCVHLHSAGPLCNSSNHQKYEKANIECMYYALGSVMVKGIFQNSGIYFDSLKHTYSLHFSLCISK
jgi:hypothetical protein